MAWVMSTLGFGILLQSAAFAVGPAPVTVPAPFGDEVIRVFGAGVRTQELLLLAVAVIVMLAFDRIMNGSMLGRAMRAVAANPAVANLMGINVNAVMIGASSPARRWRAWPASWWRRSPRPRSSWGWRSA